MRVLFPVLIAILAALTPAAAQAKRMALVVGIDAYLNLDGSAQLKRAVNDARSVTLTLRGLGFNVTPLENANRSAFNAAWQQFLGAIEPGDEIAFFFSGHGVEIEGQNFLVPGDIPKINYGRQEQIKRESLSVSELLLDLRRRKPRVSLIILDACRDHPLAPPEWKSGEKPGGLAKIDAPEGTFIMYSAWAGQRALDRLPENDPDPTNSVYTRKLLPLMQKPGLSLTDLAKHVRREVSALAATVSHPQTPAYYDGILGDYCLAGCGDAPSTSEAKPTDKTPQQAATPLTNEDKVQRLVRSFTGHSEGVTSVAFSPDGRFALSGSHDTTLKLWDVGSAKALRSFAGHSSTVFSVAFSPDGRLALSGGSDKTLKLWDVGSAKELRSFAGHSSIVFSVAFSPDGRLALSGSGDLTLKLWDVGSAKALRSFAGHSHWILSVAFSPDGRFALSGSLDNTLTLWDVGSAKELRSFAGHSLGSTSVAFSPDGRFALSDGWDYTLKMLDVGSAKELRSFTGHSATVNSVAFSPDGRFVLSGSADKTLKLWDAETAKELRSFTGHSGNVKSVAFSPDGRFALSGSDDNTLRLWDVSEWTAPPSAQSTKPILQDNGPGGTVFKTIITKD